MTRNDIIRMAREAGASYIIGICHGACFGLLAGEALALLEWCK
jgi:hypothetical protein